MKKLISYLFPNVEDKILNKRIQLITCYANMLDNCQYNTFERVLLTKALTRLNENECPYKVEKWLNKIEKDFNKSI